MDDATKVNKHINKRLEEQIRTWPMAWVEEASNLRCGAHRAGFRKPSMHS